MPGKPQSRETELIIRHIPDGDVASSEVGRQRFRVERRADGKEGQPVEIVSPDHVAIEGQAGSHLLVELQWYLEKFLEYPFSPNTERADRILAALAQWGRDACGKNSRRLGWGRFLSWRILRLRRLSGICRNTEAQRTQRGRWRKVLGDLCAFVFPSFSMKAS